MGSKYDNDLLKEATYHVKSGDHETARRYLQRALDLADDLDTKMRANYFMAVISKDPAEKRNYLENVLAIDPVHPEARRELALLDGRLKQSDIVDPNNLPLQSSDPQNVQADRFTCPRCGGKMVFDGDGSLTCEYCSRNETLDSAVPEMEKDFILAMATGQGHRKPVATQVFHCQGCGAEFILPPNVLSQDCSYCGSPHVVSQGSRELLEPDAIIPMALNQRQAARQLVNWVEKNKIEPSGKVQAPRGVYLPVWTFDIGGNVPWNGIIQKKDTVQRVSGIYPVFSNDLPIPAARHLPELMEKLLPEFNFPSAAVYDPRYLSGWPAEVHEIAMSDASLQARQKMVARLRRDIHSQHRGVSNLGYSTSGIFVQSFKLVLVPIWLTDVPYEGKILPVVINGSSGQVHGETPNRGILDWLGDWLAEE